jgi:transcriptional regulator with XRE-family HTH domain
MKRKSENELPPLCVAVKRIREAYGDSQERFARRIGVALMTVSRFETGRAEPRDPRVLLNLASVAYENSRFLSDPERKELQDAEKLFRDAYADFERIKQNDSRVGELERLGGREFFGAPAVRSHESMREWRLDFAVRLSFLYTPERVAGIEQAAAPMLAMIDEILGAADENQQIDYSRFERDVLALAEKRTLQNLKQQKGKQK